MPAARWPQPEDANRPSCTGVPAPQMTLYDHGALNTSARARSHTLTLALRLSHSLTHIEQIAHPVDETKGLLSLSL